MVFALPDMEGCFCIALILTRFHLNLLAFEHNISCECIFVPEIPNLLASLFWPRSPTTTFSMSGKYPVSHELAKQVVLTERTATILAFPEVLAFNFVVSVFKKVNTQNVLSLVQCHWWCRSASWMRKSWFVVALSRLRFCYALQISDSGAKEV